ncbi:iron complex transport system permease protein [Cyclobacterium lianum]|uniref:Iron complex transport system permease protein n=1 Tax=Cyclobacterium lianum TaxID=388280 RepID=A0A1M7P9M5_9BACT|nr:iron ABC transporter permease [Cyclobacterium lianum]SHN13141.1 iron complex transport system permease protein [Cyclobacterium lianum]
MNKPRTYKLLFCLFLCLLLWLINLSLGSVAIPLRALIERLAGIPFERDSWEIIVMEYRLPKSLTAVLVGIALPISGLQMQTFFRNPLAGPYVLGISSGAGLGVALLSMAGTAFGWHCLQGSGNHWAAIVAASLGAIAVLVLMGLAAWKVRDSMSLLIVGLMFGSAASSLITLLAYFSAAEELKMFTIWSMGNLGNSGWSELGLLSVLLLLGLLPALLSVKAFNAMLLGENYAISMGINFERLRWSMILSTGLLTGSITAFCGPIAFIGIAVPHLARLLFRTNDHTFLFPAAALLGVLVLLVCDSISQLPGMASSLPINAVTTAFGAPLIIWLIMRRNFSEAF